jgi:hypothetical protein
LRGRSHVWSGRPSHHNVDVEHAEVDSGDTESDSDSSSEQDDDGQPAKVEKDDEVDDPVSERPKDDDDDPRVESPPWRTDEDRPSRDRSTQGLRLLARRRLLLLNLLYLRNVQ